MPLQRRARIPNTEGRRRRREGSTTVITPKSIRGRITLMTDHDMKTIAKWVRWNDQEEGASGSC